MTESVEQWWRRRQWSTGRSEPYAVGAHRAAWSPYPVLVEQFRPERNGDLLLSQIPPAADVWLVWVCALRHEFVATPAEQRARPGASRSARSWCPVCAAPSEAPPPGRRWPSASEIATAGGARGHDERAGAVARARAHPSRASRPRHVPAAHRAVRTVDGSTVPPGRAFRSARAPRATSASEGRVRALLAERLAVDLSANAVRVRTAFFDRLEVWPDIVIPELALAIELDTIGRAGDEHVGRREAVDRRKDRLLREVGWEVIRVRVRPLAALGPHDLVVPGISQRAAEQLIERIGEARGELMVAAYRRA
ncbi:hypothetical protein OVN18_11235 [Microcella daejeonensis]|uniref:Zinc-ribbon domain-containing protein n=1 Tax=Microcella daejeonensis TaxID=2994971 RepID=A0A9E8MKB2_9MICO|nr:hypothetical protein [Microcella daejeonensis]WAB81108.1 hypothetical protein OVN18_11235 [Microcella daejeonensis]